MAHARVRLSRLAVAAASLLVPLAARAEGMAPLEASTPPASPPPTADEPTAAGPPGESKKNPANYEFGFVTVGAYQTWAIAGNVLFFGVGGGLGPTLYRYSKLSKTGSGWDPTLEIAYGN